MEDKKTNKRPNVLISIAAIGVVLCVCLAVAATAAVIMSGETTPAVSELQSSSSPATEFPKAAETDLPSTDVPAPTNTLAPTAISLPTLPPTETPTPTVTLPPTATPEPLVFSGQGDAVLDVSFPGPGTLQIIGNDASRHFAIESYTATGDYIDLLVNTTEPYQGRCPINWEGTQAARLVVSTTGPWQITYYPLLPGYTTSLVVPGTYQGQGDDVIALTGAAPDTATVTGNAASRHFAIISHTASTAYDGLLVNTTDPYQGTVILSPTAFFLVINATGPWTIQVTGK